MRNYFALITLLLSFSCIEYAHADFRGLPSITVLADDSTTLPITELARIYSQERNVTVTTSYESSGQLAEMIGEGQSADVVITAHDKWINDLKQQGVVNVSSITTLVKNTLVLAIANNHALLRRFTPPANANDILPLIAKRQLPVPVLVMADANESPLGIYTQQALEKLGLWKSIQPILLPTSNAMEALYLTAKGENVGILYSSSTYNNPEITVLAPIDENIHNPAIYWAAVVVDENMEQGSAFLEFLKSDRARQVFEKYGFVPMDGAQ